MDATTASSFHSTSASPYPSQAARFSCGGGGECRDGMVKIELEAAEALAGLAHFSMPETDTETRSPGSSQRVKDESPARVSALNGPETFVPIDSDPPEFRRHFEDWELNSVNRFLRTLYSWLHFLARLIPCN